jgi:hypothetical protein
LSIDDLPQNVDFEYYLAWEGNSNGTDFTTAILFPFGFNFNQWFGYSGDIPNIYFQGCILKTDLSSWYNQIPLNQYPTGSDRLCFYPDYFKEYTYYKTSGSWTQAPQTTWNTSAGFNYSYMFPSVNNWQLNNTVITNMASVWPWPDILNDIPIPYSQLSSYNFSEYIDFFASPNVFQLSEGVPEPEPDPEPDPDTGGGGGDGGDDNDNGGGLTVPDCGWTEPLCFIQWLFIPQQNSLNNFFSTFSQFNNKVPFVFITVPAQFFSDLLPNYDYLNYTQEGGGVICNSAWWTCTPNNSVNIQGTVFSFNISQALSNANQAWTQIFPFSIRQVFAASYYIGIFWAFARVLTKTQSA